MGDLLVPGQQLGARRAHVLARLVEAERRLPHLLLQHVEAFAPSRRARRASWVFTGTMLTDACAASRSPRPSAAMACEKSRSVPERQALGRLADLRRRVGDHARQHQPDADRQQRDGDEDVLQRGDQQRVVAVRHAVDRHEIAGAVEHQHEQHGAGELDVQRLGDDGQACAPAVLDHAPSVERGAGIGQARGRTGPSAGRTAGSRGWRTAARSQAATTPSMMVPRGAR